MTQGSKPKDHEQECHGSQEDLEARVASGNIKGMRHVLKNL